MSPHKLTKAETVSPQHLKRKHSNTDETTSKKQKQENEVPRCTPTTPTKQANQNKKVSDSVVKQTNEEIERILELVGKDITADNETTFPRWMRKKDGKFRGALKLLEISAPKTSKSPTDIRNLGKDLQGVLFNQKDDSSIQNILLRSPKYKEDPGLCTPEEISYAHWCLFPFMYPSKAFSEITTQPSELELTIRLFGYLCNMCALFGNATTKAGVKLDMTHANISFSNEQLNNKEDALMPDRHVTFLVQKKNAQVVRVLQEDILEHINTNQTHKDELKMLFLLKICHAKLMGEILIDKPTPDALELFNQIYTYGFLTNSNRVELIGVRCDVKYNDSGYELNYKLDHFGTHTFLNKTDKVNEHVMQTLCGKVMAIFLTCANQHKQIDCLLQTGSMTEDDNIIEDDNRHNKIITFERGQKLKLERLIYKNPSANGVVVETIQQGKKNIAKVKLDNSVIVYLKHFTKPSNVQFGDSISYMFNTVDVISLENFTKYERIEISFGGDCLENKIITSFDEAIKIIIQLLIEVHHIHTLQYKKTIHNDIKLGNIVIYKGFAKLIDFEIMKEFDVYDEETQQCKFLDEIVTSKTGTRGTKPPEKLETGNGEITPMSDIYSLGIVFQQLLNRVVLLDPFIKEKMNEMIKGMLEEEKKNRWSIKKCRKHLIDNGITDSSQFDKEVEEYDSTNKKLDDEWKIHFKKVKPKSFFD